MRVFSERHTVFRSATGRAAMALCFAGVATSAFAQDATPQTDTSPLAVTSDAALAALPDPGGYSLAIVNDGLRPDAVEAIAQMLRNAMGESHFFGAVYAYLPEGSTQLSIRVRAGLHSPEAANRMALRDCEEERRQQDSPCRLLATVMPENWVAAEGLRLSSDASYAFAQGAPQMEKPLFLARSRDTPRFAIWSGENARQSALDECNELVGASGADPDCDIVIDDRLSSDR